MNSRLGMPGRKDLPMKLGPGHRETLFLSQPPPDERLLLLAPSRNLLQLKDGRAHCDIR
jgi:hypothetical protein